MTKVNETVGKATLDGRKKASRIPDPERRMMLKKLRAVAIAVPAAIVLLGSKEDMFAS